MTCGGRLSRPSAGLLSSPSAGRCGRSTTSTRLSISSLKRELFEQRHSRELILYDAAARYLKELKASGEELSPKEWRREIDLLTAQKQVDSIDMKAMREELKAVERLRKAADQLARQEQDKPRDQGPER